MRSYNKSKDSYGKLIADAETAIRARDAAIRENEVKPAVDSQNNIITGSKITDILILLYFYKCILIYSLYPLEEGFFSKMLKPNVAKLQERCSDIIRDIDTAAHQLANTAE